MTQATVETLTAEVRTLVVGNRQVTLSVYNQLDWVEPDEITPFGRVRRRDPGHALEVVGATTDGALVRSGLDMPQRSDELVTVSPEGLPFVYGRTLAKLQQLPRVVAEVNGIKVIYRGTKGGTFDPDVDGWRFTERAVHDEAVLDAQALVASLIQRRATWATWDALPLIVLAGLR